MYRLIALVGSGAPFAAALPPFIYIFSTSGNWEKNWVARIEQDSEVLNCAKDKDEIGYRILVETDSKNIGEVNLRADHIPGFKQKTYGIQLRFQKADSNFMISDEGEESQAAHGGGGVYCKSSMKWNAEGVKIDGEDVGERNTLSSKSWGGSLNYLALKLKRANTSECIVSLMKVVCQLEWAKSDDGIASEIKESQVDNSKLNMSGLLPNLVYRPF